VTDHAAHVLAIPASLPCQKTSLEKKERPSLHLAPSATTRIGAANLNSGERRFTTCQPLVAQTNWSNWSNLVNWSNFGQILVNIVKMVK